MMNRITVIGDTSSGKTCFLYAMYNFIAEGYVDGFTMSATSDEKDSQLQKMYKILGDKSLGLDRFPAASQSRDEYEFSLQYGFKEIASFQWSDYPGAYITNQGEGSTELINDLASSDAWVIFIDGEKLREAILENATMRRKKLLMDICGKYNRFIANNRTSIPVSVPIIVTKSDALINPLIEHYMLEGENETKAATKAFFEVEAIVKQGLSAFFADTNESLKSISIVTLGDQLMENGYSGELDPINIEYPITLSMLSILSHNFDRVFNRIADLKKMIEHDKTKFFSSAEKRNQWQKEIDKIRPQLHEWQKMAKAILSTLAESKKLWKGNMEINLVDYYSNELLLNEE